MVHIMGINLRQAQIANLAMKINHSGFRRCTLVWNEVYDGVGGWRNVAQF
jgi:hypothetical protein